MIYYDFTHGNIKKTLMGYNANDCAASLLKAHKAAGLETTQQECLQLVALKGYNKRITQAKKPAVVQSKKKMSMVDVINGGLALVDILKGDLADDETIIARSKICEQCPVISDTADSCVGCAGKKLVTLARNLAVKYGRNFYNPKITPVNIKPPMQKPISNFYCGFCGCNCLNLVLSKDKHFVNKEKEDRPANCWVHSL